MKTRFLLSHKYKKLGWVLFFPALALGLVVFLAGYEPAWLDLRVPHLFYDDFGFGSERPKGFYLLALAENNLANEIAGVLLLLSCMLLVFSAERDEDEFIAKLRLESILWSAFIYGLILFFSLLLIYDIAFFYVMVGNLFLLFLLFIVRFHWELAKFRRQAE